jgi:hypothetical protein
MRERERPQLSMRGGLTKRERTLRQDWPVVDSSWRGTGVEELPCELVREWHFLGSGVPVKQLRSQRKEMGIGRERERESESGTGWERPGEQSQCWELNPIQVTAPNVRKNTAHEKSLTSIGQSLMAGPNC